MNSTKWKWTTIEIGIELHFVFDWRELGYAVELDFAEKLIGARSQF